MAQENYSFMTKNERLHSIGYTAGSLGLVAFGMSQILNPIGMAVLGGFALGQVGKVLSQGLPFFSRRYVKKCVKSGEFQPVAAQERVCRIAKELSESYGLPEVKIYTTKVPAAADSFFAALLGTNTILTTKEALAEEYSDKELRFILAHEMSHLKTDYPSPEVMSLNFLKRLPKVLLYVAALNLVAISLLGPGAAMIATLQAPLLGIGTYLVSSLAAQFVACAGHRAMEKRADRNALYITRDLEGAEDVIDTIYDPETQKPRAFIAEGLATHPGYAPRKRALKQAFNVVSKYPPLQAAHDDVAVKPKSKNSAKLNHG